MVLAVCRRHLHNHHDAEDAFQAVFIVLARKASSVSPREAVGNWLYGVACLTARRAKAVSARRRSLEREASTVARSPDPTAPNPDLHQVLDSALSRLPAKYRTPIVLCDLEGRTRKSVAAQLDIPDGTLSSRLAAAKQMLARRLT